ncbi:JAB domain-containing protein, partial [Bordetella bronchiseptica]|uniref:LPD3 domain-containing protein n=1 Tax=Bordetella bronchiseptica TaxID=518 RepID=UPI001377DAF0
MPAFKDWLATGDTTKPAGDANSGDGGIEQRAASGAAMPLPNTRSAARAITMDPGPDGKYAVSVESKEIARVRADGGVLQSRAQVASALSALRKSPQEQMVALFTDEVGRPISILRHTIGRKSSADIVHGLIAGHGARLGRAANVWLAHNHPSGYAELSRADIQTTDAYQRLTEGSRVKLRGMLAIGKSSYGHYDPATGEQGTDTIRPTRRGSEIPVTERVFHQRATLAKAITSPSGAKEVMREVSGGDAGIMLLNAKNEPIAFVPMAETEMAKLRGTGGLDKALAGLERSNASAAILNVAAAGDLSAAKNLGRMLEDADVRVHDILAGGESMASAGQGTAASKPFQSRAPNPTSEPTSRVTVETGERLARDFMEKLPGAAGLRVSVVKSVDQIPEGAKPSALAEGAYYPARDGGRIYLVAENLPTAERLEQVLAHEVVGHFGVEALLGDRFREVLVDVRRLARAPDGAHIPKNAGPEHPHYATFEAVTARYPDYSAENRAREVLARMAEQGKRTIFLERLYGKIRAALRRLGLNLKLTNAEIRQMVVDAGRFLQRAPAARVSAGMQEAAASMAASRAADSGGAAVTVLTGQELGSPELGAKELRDAARAWAAENLKGKDFVNRATGWRVQVSQRGIKESLSRSARISKIQSMAALPGLIEQAILGHTEPNRNKQRDPFTSQVHTLYAPVEIGGQDYLARLVVKESANGHLFYDHDLSDVVEAKRPDNTSAVSTPATKAGADRTPSGRAFTVEEIGEIVNREGRAGWVFDPGPLESRGEAAPADAP